jgi:hypothetical protein
MMFITLAAVVLGMSSQWPGLGVPLGFVAFFVWLRTVSVVRHRVTAGQSVSAPQKIQLFLSSFIGTVGVIILIAVTGAAALATACAVTIAAIEPKASMVLGVAIATAAIAILGIFALRRIFASINRRV